MNRMYPWQPLNTLCSSQAILNTLYSNVLYNIQHFTYVQYIYAVWYLHAIHGTFTFLNIHMFTFDMNRV